MHCFEHLELVSGFLDTSVSLNGAAARAGQALHQSPRFRFFDCQHRVEGGPLRFLTCAITRCTSVDCGRSASHRKPSASTSSRDTNPPCPGWLRVAERVGKIVFSLGTAMRSGHIEVSPESMGKTSYQPSPKAMTSPKIELRTLGLWAQHTTSTAFQRLNTDHRSASHVLQKMISQFRP